MVPAMRCFAVLGFVWMLLGCSAGSEERTGAGESAATPSAGGASPTAEGALVPPVTGADDSDVYGCKPIRAGQKLSVEFREGYSALDIAQWLMGWSCRTVVIPHHARHRRSEKSLSAAASGAELADLLARLLHELQLSAVSEGAVTVFVDDDERLRDGKPGLVWTADPDGPAARAARAARAVSAAKGDPLRAMLADSITELEGQKYRITREAVDALIANPVAIARDARIVPSIEDGKSNGFKLYAIRPNSLWAQLGLANGDTIHKINGHELTTPDKVLEVYTKLSHEKDFAVDLTRRGKPLTIEYQIR